MERKFAELRRAQPTKQSWEIAKLAGYRGDRRKLTSRASDLLRSPDVLAAVYAPLPPSALTDEEQDEFLKKKIRDRLVRIVDSGSAEDADAIRACDKLLATIAGGYVPVQLQQKGSFTLESWVRQMGGAPQDDREHELDPERGVPPRLNGGTA
jgi:hypothetical protein